MTTPSDTKRDSPSEAMRKGLLADPATHEWLGRAIAEATTRDPVDALRDAQVLRMYCALRLSEAEAAFL